MLRKLIGVVMVLAMLSTVTPAMAADESQVDVYNQQKQLVKSVVFVIGMDQYFVNGQTPGQKMDARPFIQNDRTYVPVRYLSYALGVTPENVNWDNGQQKATIKLGGNTVEMIIGKKQIIGNGLAKDIDVAPVINEAEGRTYLPARYVAEGLGYEVAWDEQSNSVICWPKGASEPDISAVKQYVKQQQQLPSEPLDNKYKDYKPIGDKVIDLPNGGGMVNTNTGGVFDPSEWNIVH